MIPRTCRDAAAAVLVALGNDRPASAEPSAPPASLEDRARHGWRGVVSVDAEAGISTINPSSAAGSSAFLPASGAAQARSSPTLLLSGER